MNPLVLHAVRLKGFADTQAVAARFGLDVAETHEELLDGQAFGWVSRSDFAGLSGWSLTEAGRRANTAMLRDELTARGVAAEVERAHEAFLPLNAQAVQVFTAFQLGETDVAPLTDLADRLGSLQDRLTACLPRFSGYHSRFTAALSRVAAEPQWVTGVEVDSCHRVWFELHEDLVATLGITR